MTSQAALLLLIVVGAVVHAIPDDVMVIDGHNDLPYNLYGKLQNNLKNFRFDEDLSNDPVWGLKSCSSCYTDLVRLKKGKVGAQFWVAYVSCDIQYKDALAKTMEQIDVIKRLVQKYSNQMAFVTDSAGIISARGAGKIASLIGVEGGHSIDSRLGVLRLFYELGVRYLTLTHSCNTPWADNSYVANTGTVHNLTAYGKLVVKEMNRLGMMVDLSHVSHEVMNQAILASEAPVIFSHSSAYGVYDHNRNVPDDTLELLKTNQGIVMVNFYPGFISPKPEDASIHDVAEHINYIVKKIGVDYVGLGGDYDGVSSQPKQLEDVSKYPDLLELLQTEDPVVWTDENIKKLASENFLRVFKAVEAVKASKANQEPVEEWIPFDDLNAAEEKDQLWKCRTLLNNTSPETKPNHQNSIRGSSVVLGVTILTGIVARIMF